MSDQHTALPIESMADVNPFLRDPRLTMASGLPNLTFLGLPKMPIYWPTHKIVSTAEGSTRIPAAILLNGIDSFCGECEIARNERKIKFWSCKMNRVRCQNDRSSTPAHWRILLLYPLSGVTLFCGGWEIIRNQRKRIFWSYKGNRARCQKDPPSGPAHWLFPLLYRESDFFVVDEKSQGTNEH